MKKLKTEKGSTIARSQHGVGKWIGGALYVHKNYIPDQYLPLLLTMIQKWNPTEQLGDWNLVKIYPAEGQVTFYTCSEFDTVAEPAVGTYITCRSDIMKKGTSKALYHHKWLWVGDDYHRFDVQQSFERSEAWLRIPKINFAKIGNANHWKAYKLILDKEY